MIMTRIAGSLIAKTIITVKFPVSSESGYLLLVTDYRYFCPLQEIKGIDIDESISAFGCSIYGDTDMDGNLYPDIIVGAYLSAHAVMIRWKHFHFSYLLTHEYVISIFLF